MYLWIPLPEGDRERRRSPSGSWRRGRDRAAGIGFGAGGEGFFRISFITSPERIAEAAQRAGRVLASRLRRGVA